MTRVTLLTDFGTADGYAAALKAVIASLAPRAVVEDATHDIEPGAIAAAGLALSRYWRLYPGGTVHVAVVDPGVGSGRRALACAVDGRFLVAPDNGLLTRILDAAGDRRCVAIENPAYLRPQPSATFHGRDVFAPAAAHLAAGVALDELGPRVSDPLRLESPPAIRTDAGVRGRVVHVDRFGNLITDIPAGWLAGGRVRVRGRDVGPVRRTYADVPSGQPLALVGSIGVLEVSVRDGRADAALGVGVGHEVTVET